MGSTEKPVAVIAALQEVLKINGSVDCELSINDGLVLQKYFSNNISVIGTMEAASTIKRLPIFYTVYHKMVSIGSVRAYIVCGEIPHTEVEIICKLEGIILLQSNRNLEPLLRYLGCSNMQEVTFYCNYLFKHFQLLSDEGRCIHIKHIREVLLPKLELEDAYEFETLLNCLRQLAFIPRGSDNTLARASEFYDRTVELICVMHDETEFPPPPYNDCTWTDFLRKCGLVHEVTQDMFLGYARQVASSGQMRITEREHTRSNALLEHLFSHEQLLRPAVCVDFLRQLRTVEFIVPHSVGSVRENLYKQYGKRNSDGNLLLVAFADSIGSEWADAVWSAQNVVPQSVFEPIETYESADWVHSELQFHQKPTFPIVVKHTEQLCKKIMPMVKQRTFAAQLRKPIFPILCAIYEVLSNFTDLQEDAKSTLSKTSFVIDLERQLLVRPNQVVLRLAREDEIVPYLISMPRNILAHGSLFCELGARESPTLDQYVMVLEMIHDVSRDEVLHPDERQKVSKAMNGFFHLLQSSEVEIAINDELYFPGRNAFCHRSREAEEWKLYRASTLVFDDAKLYRRLEGFDEPLMLPLSDCGVVDISHSPKDLLRRLPSANRPKFLSEVVEEVVDNGHNVSGCSFAQQLQEKFISDDFRNSVVRVALHRLKTPSNEETEQVKKAVEGLSAIRFVGVDTLTTYLVYNSNRIQRSDRYKKYHVHRETASKYLIFISTNAKVSLAFYKELAEVVKYVTGNVIKVDLYLLKMIIKCEMGMESHHLDEEDVPSYATRPSNNTFVPLPGAFVPLIYHHLLRQDVQRLNPGDFAAMETDDPMENGELEPATYILVKVVAVVTEDADGDEVPAATLHYQVLVEPGKEITVSAVVLYAFVRDDAEIERTSDTFMDDTELCVGIDVQPAGTSTKPKEPADYDTIVRDLRKQLREAWRIPEADRKKFVKRLLLRWHPDKNPDNIRLATTVTQFILDALDRLEKGLTIDDNEEVTTATGYGYRGWSGGSGHSTWGGFHRSYYEHMNQRARRHQQQHQDFASNTSNRRRPARWRGGFFAQFYTHLNPQPGEARRWLRQATADVDAAVNDQGCGRCCAFEWACYKYYRVSLFSSTLLLANTDACYTWS